LARRRGTRAGGRRWVPALCLCGAGVLGAGAPSAGGGATATGVPAIAQFPREADGEIPFVVDVAALVDAAGAAELYFTLDIASGELRCVTQEEGAGSQVDLRLEIASLDAGERVLLRQGRRLTASCGGAAGDQPPLLLYLQVPRQPGASVFEVTLRDEHAPRVSLTAMMREEKRQGRARGRLEVPPLREGRGLSGCILLSEAPFAPGVQRVRSFLLGFADSLRGQIVPRPARSYGLRGARAHIYAEAYQLGGAEGELRLRLRSSPEGPALTDERVSVRLPAERTGIVATLDVSALPAGTYWAELEFYPWDESGEPYRSGGRLHVLWRPESWEKSQAALLEESILLLPEEAARRYRSLDVGDREAYVESLWTAQGGSAGAGSGSSQARFQERVATADARYRWGDRRGATTDRGRVFVRYGEPDDIRKELHPQLRDQIFQFLEREIDAERAASGTLLRPHRLDGAAYEVWRYSGRGEPLVTGWETQAPESELEFIFVDRLGSGDYQLVYSSVGGEF